MPKAPLALSGNPEADRLLSDDPLALLIGMVLDQQVPLERAFTSPLDLKNRLGGRLDAEEIASMDPDKLAAVFSTRPALPRFPAAGCSSFSAYQRSRYACASLSVANALRAWRPVSRTL